MSSSPDDLFEIEKEYDARYEGLDFDDVDERPKHMTETQEEDPTLLQSTLPLPPFSQKATQDIHDNLEALERAEALEEQLNAPKQPKSRIIDRLEGNSNNGPTVGGGGVAAPLASSQKKLTDALAANSELSPTIKNPFAFVAALTLDLIVQGTSKSTLLAKLAAAVRCLKTASTQEQLLKSLGLAENTNLTGKVGNKNRIHLDKNESKHLSLEIKRAFELAEECNKEPHLQEQTVRALLKLAPVPVTASILSECDQAGKKMRKLKNHPVQAVALASEAVVKAWRQTVS